MTNLVLIFLKCTFGTQNQLVGQRTMANISVGLGERMCIKHLKYALWTTTGNINY